MFFILLILINIGFGAILFDNVVAESSRLFVGGSGLDNFDTIQDAVDAASDGDEIFVYNGIYIGNVVIDKSIRIIGENKFSTIIDGDGIGDVFEILSDDVYISNITIRNSGINLENDSITFAGAYIKSSNNSIVDTIFIDCYVGIILLNSTGNVIDDCEFDNNAGGINLFNTSDSILSNCSITNNYRLWGLSFQRADNNIISNCNVSDNIEFGLAMTQSDNNKIFNNIFSGNDNGVLVVVTSFEPCEFNLFYLNDFINSIILNVRDYCENEFWDDGFNGNYWSEFDEPVEGAWDNNSDGVIDQSFNIIPTSVGNKDNYPLVNPVNVGGKIPSINNPPIISNGIPRNNAVSLSILFSSLSVDIEDVEMDVFNWSIETSPNVGSNSGFNDVNGVKTCSISDLSYDTTYIWFVNASDTDGSGVFTRESFVFTTESLEDNGDGVPGFGIPIFLLSLFSICFIIVIRKLKI